MKTTSLCLISLALASLAAPVRAQEIPSDSTRPFVEGGAYDKPFLTRLAGRTAIGGYAEANARWERSDGLEDGSGFELKRWNIFTFTQVNDFIRLGAELEFEELAEEITLEFAAIDFTIHPALTVRAGAILAPLGRFNLSHDSPRNEFTDRPFVSTEIIGTALTEVGLGVLGQLGAGGAGRFTYEVYAVNGFHDGLIQDSPDGTRIPLGKKNFEDNNGSPAAVGRLAFSPRLGYELGVSGHWGAYNTFSADGETIDDRRDLAIWVLDFEADVVGFEVSGEAATASIDITPGLEGIYASGQNGLYVQAVRSFGHGWVSTMPASRFQAGARYDVVDFDTDLTGDSARRVTFGVNFLPTEDTALKFDYLRGWTRDRFNNPGEQAGLLFSIATYF